MKNAAAIDSSSLIFALRVQPLFDLLERRFSKLLAPQAVYKEVVKAGEALGKEDAPKAKALIARGFLRVRDAKPLSGDPRLGAGETEALSIAFREKIILVSDDRLARNAGKAMGVRVIPLSAFILWAKEKKLVTPRKAEETLNELVKKGYYLKAETYIALLEKIREATP